VDEKDPVTADTAPVPVVLCKCGAYVCNPVEPPDGGAVSPAAAINGAVVKFGGGPIGILGQYAYGI